MSDKRKHVYIICAVRGAPQARIDQLREYANSLRGAAGYTVHFPPDDAPQSDPTGSEICHAHRKAMLAADEVHVFWDVDSKGSHFDLGMAYALDKRIVPVMCERPDNDGKSYWKVMCSSVLLK